MTLYVATCILHVGTPETILAHNLRWVQPVLLCESAQSGVCARRDHHESECDHDWPE